MREAREWRGRRWQGRGGGTSSTAEENEQQRCDGRERLQAGKPSWDKEKGPAALALGCSARLEEDFGLPHTAGLAIGAGLPRSPEEEGKQMRGV